MHTQTLMRRLLPKVFLDWSDRLDLYLRDKHGVSPKQKAIEWQQDNWPSERIETAINEALRYGGDITMINADKQHRKHKEKKKPKKPK